MISLLFIGCAGLPEFPVRDAYVVDFTHGVCSQKQATGLDSQNRLIWKHVADLPLKACNGNVSVKHKDYLKADDWRIDIETNYTCKKNQ